MRDEAGGQDVRASARVSIAVFASKCCNAAAVPAYIPPPERCGWRWHCPWRTARTSCCLCWITPSMVLRTNEWSYRQPTLPFSLLALPHALLHSLPRRPRLEWGREGAGLDWRSEPDERRSARRTHRGAVLPHSQAGAGREPRACLSTGACCPPWAPRCRPPGANRSSEDWRTPSMCRWLPPKRGRLRSHGRQSSACIDHGLKVGCQPADGGAEVNAVLCGISTCSRRGKRLDSAVPPVRGP